VVAIPLKAGGRWAVDFDGHRHVKFAAVINGHCWLTVEGAGAPIELAQGDCYLVIGDRRYQLASDLDVEAVPAVPVFTHLVDGAARCGSGQDTMLIGGNFTFDEANAALLLDGLPPVIHVPAASDHAGLIRATLHLIGSEASTAGLGSALMLDRLAHVLFLQALRAYARERASARNEETQGLLPALLDPEVGPALRLMHGDLTRNWTVASLATAVTMSRSSFAPPLQGNRRRSPGGVPDTAAHARGGTTAPGKRPGGFRRRHCGGIRLGDVFQYGLPACHVRFTPRVPHPGPPYQARGPGTGAANVLASEPAGRYRARHSLRNVRVRPDGLQVHGRRGGRRWRPR
jgi:hypothetical protein